MRVDVLTLFPGLFDGFKKDALIKRALQKGELELHVWPLRSWARSRHQQLDDYPFGGGPGMVLKPEPIFTAMDDLLKERSKRPVTIHFSPAGELLNQNLIEELHQEEQFIFICGRYKGIDQRVIDRWVDRQISIGDYVLSGGELPAMVLLEGLVRLIPGVLNDIQSAQTDSFAADLLEGPIYTRPEEFRGHRVPEILLSGNHELIADWRTRKAMEITRKRRPDLWNRYVGKVRPDKEEKNNT